MKRALLLSMLLAVGCGPCRRDEPPPPARDELTTALTHFRESIAAHPHDVALARQIVKIAAAQDAAFAADGDGYRHHVYPEPPDACLEDGTCFSGYLQFLVQEEQRAFGPKDTPELEARAQTLAPALDLPTLAAEVARRERWVVEHVERAPTSASYGDGPRIVYLLSTGHALEARRQKAIERVLAKHPGTVRFVEVKRAAAPTLFEPLGKRVTAAAVLDGKLVLDVVHEEQWLELLFPSEPLPPLGPRSELPVIDAHAHVTAGGGPRLSMALANEGISGVVVAALPTADDLLRTNEDILAIARKEPPFVAPFVTVDPRADDAPARMRALLDRGARGLKLLTGHDDLYRALERAPLDPPPLRRVFSSLGTTPVLWHVNPHLYREGFVRMLREFPKVTVVNPHLGGYLTFAPGIVRRLLQRYPNLSFDLSFGAQPRYVRRAFEDLSALRDAWRALLIEFPDRFLFGLDVVVTPNTSLAHVRMLDRAYRDLLEAEELDFDFFPARGFSVLGEESHHHARLRGLALPKEVLAKLYAGNAERLYGLKPPG